MPQFFYGVEEGTLPERRREYAIRAVQRRYVDISTEPLYFARQAKYK